MTDTPDTSPPEPRATGAKIGLALLGLDALLFVGALAWLTLGEAAAGVAVIAVIAVTVWGLGGDGRTRRLAMIGLGAAATAALLVLVIGVMPLLSALGDETGPVDPPDAAALQAAETKRAEIADDAGFRLTLTEAELNAVLQDGLAESSHPFRSVTVDVHDNLAIDFVGRFKGGGLDVEGTVAPRLRAGRIELELVSANAGMFRAPSLARDAIEDIIGDLVDLQEALGDVDIQGVEMTESEVTIFGINRGVTAPDPGAVLTQIRRQIDLRAFDVELEAKYPPGRVAGTEEPGEPVYLALGDSLAANVGVDDPRLGYVSKFHLQLEQRDGATYGLRNLGVPGETSASFVREQLPRAEALAGDLEVKYITIDLGANDLLGHLTSDDCATGLAADACRARIDGTFRAYADNLEVALSRLEAAFPQATIIYLQIYNPFAFGFPDAVSLEAETNDAVRQFNALGAAIAQEHEALVADGFTPMLATTTVTTHMSDNPPDIHPTELGYDRLTEALVRALG